MSKARSRLAPALAFAVKEIREVLRQPRLIAALVVGPFVILGLFGMGYQATPPPLRTMLVVPENSELADRVTEIGEALEPSVTIVGVTSDEAAAHRKLLDREIDVVVVAPPDAVDTIRSNQHAKIRVLHDKLDPFDRAYIAIFTRASIDEFNRAVLEEVATSAQARVDAYDDAIPRARESATRMRQALAVGDLAGARQARLETELALARTDLDARSDLFSGLERQLGTGGSSAGGVSEVRSQMDDLRLDEPGAADRAGRLEETLTDLEQASAEIKGLSPSVVVRPFVSETQAVVGGDIPLTTYYAPAVVIVLIQHVMVTFGALSLVREKALGTIEMFRVGPVGAGDLVAGKYAGYSLVGGVIAAALVLGVVFGFGAPQRGPWIWVALILGTTVLASLGLGLAIATFADTDAQAVQYAMMTLLFTIFFSGFVLSRSRLAPFTQAVSYAVPATPGVVALQDVMFRGEIPRPGSWVALVLYAVLGTVFAVWGLRKRVS